MVKDSLTMLQKTDVLLFCHDVDRGIDLKGKAYSPLIDSVREDLESRGFRCQVIAHPWSQLVGSTAWGTPLAMNRSYFFARIISKISRKRLSKSKQVNSFFRLYTGLIKKSAARLVITIGAPEALCNAAKSLGVYHAELLHGIGYTSLEWGWDERQPSDLPALVFSFDSTSTSTFLKLVPKGVEVLQIPHPFLKRFISNNFINKLPQEWKPPLTKNTTAYNKVILVALQWGYDGEVSEFNNILANHLFPDELVNIIKETTGDIFWRFRFHPVQLRVKRYKKHIQFVDRLCRENSNCEWEWSSSAPLPTVLSQCQGTISMSSMSVYDAAYMGVPSLLCCPTLQQGGMANDWFVDLVDAGYTTKVSMIKNDIKQWILNANKMQPLAAGLDNQDAWNYALNKMLGDSSALSPSKKTI